VVVGDSTSLQPQRSLARDQTDRPIVAQISIDGAAPLTYHDIKGKVRIISIVTLSREDTNSLIVASFPIPTDH
jgi:hypothetical protein